MHPLHFIPFLMTFPKVPKKGPLNLNLKLIRKLQSEALELHVLVRFALIGLIVSHGSSTQYLMTKSTVLLVDTMAMACIDQVQLIRRTRKSR